VQAFMRVSDSIPIVMTAVPDPVGTGLIASYARPGGRVTGTSRTTEISQSVKLLDLLRQLLPGLSRVAFAFEPANPVSANDLRDVRAAAQLVHVDVQPVEISTAQDVEPALEAALAGRPQALISTGGVILPTNLATVADFAVRHELPFASTSELTNTPQLLSYGARLLPLYYRSGNYYADRILRGAKPADLPVEQPRDLALVVNLSTAEQLGLHIPAEVAAQVTEWVR
jgi:putative tryptophan/tyrosine transport system substrate-binding protein